MSLHVSKQPLNHSNHQPFISSAAAQKVITIQDLLFQILLNLPTKSLSRFQCVSKQWLSIISTSHFRRLHTLKTTSTSTPSAILLAGENSKKSLMYLSRSNNIYRKNVTILSNMEATLLHNALPGEFILHPCNGLICIILPVNICKSRSHAFCHVYNPITNRCIDIPLPDYKQSGYLSAMNLAFDLTKSDQFKIICVWEDMIGFSFYIYSSNTNSWKNPRLSLDARHYRYGYTDYSSSRYFFRNGVFLNGKIHWVSNTKPFLCFDVENEKFRAMPSTLVSSENGRKIKYFGECNGDLQLIEECNGGATLLNVLELGRDYSKWYLKYQVDVDIVIRRYPIIVNDCGDFECDVVALRKEEDDQEKINVLLSIPGKIISLDVEDGSIIELLDVEPECGPYTWFHAYKHFETLADI